ncbi:MAG TPA: hypothetical protein VLZ78_02650 [Terrimesophilobacter sp.]|nr:hypothetical protein [Terrimesophilobacter sp.]
MKRGDLAFHVDDDGWLFVKSPSGETVGLYSPEEVAELRAELRAGEAP